MTLSATMKHFHPAVTSDSGDLWLVAVQGLSGFDSFAPVTLNPGQTGVINVTIAPSGAAGTVASGTLYVDDFVGAVPPYRLRPAMSWRRCPTPIPSTDARAPLAWAV
jgi:hypothetical protein